MQFDGLVQGVRPLNCMQFGGWRAASAGRFMIVGSFDRIATENAHDHGLGRASDWAGGE
jgi:ABC-type sulfate transport system substrate-binding protein